MERCFLMIRVCKRCVMNDSSDPTITFDENSYCNYCTNALAQINTTTYFPGTEGALKLDFMLKEIKESEKNKEFDCVMGISGGLDSSYLAYLGHKWGLRILAVHIDDGFDTEISKSNIEKLVKACGIKLLTICPDTVQFNALTKAYMKAGVPNLAVPQDNVLLAFLYDTVRKYKIKYFLSGGNFALECILQRGNTYDAMDVVNIKDIHRRFGEQPIDKLQFITKYKRFYYNKLIIGIKELRPLNYLDYNREKAFEELYNFCGFKYYGRKHLENILTAFIQLYWLPKKFGVDKRTSHLSSMIISGQISRTEALKELEQPLYDENLMQRYIEIIKDKLNISDDEFNHIMSAPTHQHTDYKTDRLYPRLQYIKHLLFR